MRAQRAWQLGFVLLIVFCCGQATAAFVSPYEWTRGVAGSTYQAWDLFTSTAGPNAPNSPGVSVSVELIPGDSSSTVIAAPSANYVQAAPTTTYGTANARDTSGSTNTFLTGGLNIYNPIDPTHIRIDVPNPNAGSAQWTTILLQTLTSGTSMNINSLTLTAGANTYTPDLNILRSSTPAGPGGFTEERAFEFMVPGNFGNYTIDFDAAGSSMSFGAAAVDTMWTSGSQALQALPEPSTIVLGLFGSATVVWVAMRRRTQSRDSGDDA